MNVLNYQRTVYVSIFFLFFTQGIFTQEVFVIPQKVFVGDKAQLIIPYSGNQTWEQVLDLPATPEVRIHRVAANNGRITVDFTAFRPGIVPFPPIIIPDAEPLDTLTVTIESILTAEDSLLSMPATPMLVPGTMLLFICSAVGVLVLLLAWIATTSYGKQFFDNIALVCRRYWLIYTVKKRINTMLNLPSVDQNLLNKLSIELRHFLTLWTGIDCLVLSAEEFNSLSFSEEKYVHIGAILSDIFYQCDMLRFGGVPIEQEQLGILLNLVQQLLKSLEKGIISPTPGTSLEDCTKLHG
ncbi:hypothetical protein PilKf_02490 [Pillotina sp. SPG140]|jgi:hypothetical protein